MKRNYLWGIIFICLALASAAYAFGIYIDSNIAKLIVSIGLILMIIVSLPRKNFFMTFILLAILIVLNRNALGFYNISIGSLFVAAILFAIGFNILFGNNRQYINSTHYSSYRKRERREVEQTPATNDKHIYENADSEHIYNYTNRFGESTKFIQGDDLKVVNLTSDFGQLSVYFDKADFNEDGATVYCGASFGAMTLYIPRKYNVDDQLTTTLGNIKTNITDIIEEDTDIITLTLKGNVTLGEIQIIRI